MRVRLTQIDGSLPNLALMKLAHWHRSKGDSVHLTRDIEAGLFEDRYDRVYASSIFVYSGDRLERFRRQWPEGIVGGTGTGNRSTVEEVIGEISYEAVDYSDFPEFDASLGFTQRGCRLSCKFCVVPQKEGKPSSVASVWDIYRGEPWPRKLHLLDNDFFGQEEDQWRARVREIREGNFRVCMTQGINVRKITEAEAEALASIEYRDNRFRSRVLYTAWDNLRDEEVFFRGVRCLERAGIPPTHLRTYMLIGFDPLETWERILHRFRRMVEIGIEPYPMVFDRQRRDLRDFQRWAVTGLYRAVEWDDYRPRKKSVVVGVGG
jgi:hypothetical protein